MSDATDGVKPIPMNFDESLINLVRLNPLLYAKEKRIKPYESIREKSEIWKSIATSLGVEPNFCMIRWKQLTERYRRESLLQKQSTNTAKLIADSPFMEKMRFLENHVNYRHKHDHLPNSSVSKPRAASLSQAEQIFDGINYEYLPEAMEAQSSTNIDIATKIVPQMTYIPTTASSSTNSILVRIKALLEGLDPVNRDKAEKRILGYLCKCQLKALENGNIDDINF